VGRGPIGGGQNVACAVVGIGVGGIPSSLEELTLVVVGVGNGALPGSGEGCDITHAVIGITIPLPAAGHGCHLQCSLDGRQVSLVISILQGSGICNDYNQKKCPGKLQGTTCENMNFGSPILATMTFDEPTGE
jgi:hypothetical protein